MSQLSAADREVHAKLAEKTRAGLPMGPNVCMSDIISLAFSFHTPTFFTKVRIS